MFYIHDLYKDDWTEFKSAESLAAWWIKKMGRDFSDLNITGNDCWRYSQWGVLDNHFHGHVTGLRRYQVLDEYSRSIDIREWSYSAWHPKPISHKYFWGFSGKKPHEHRASGPSMHHATARQALNTVNLDDLFEEDLPIPEKDRTKLRRKAVLSTWDADGYYEDVHWKHYACSKCWKDQHKSRKQWGKREHIPRVYHEIPEPGEELVERMSRELLASAR